MQWICGTLGMLALGLTASPVFAQQDYEGDAINIEGTVSEGIPAGEGNYDGRGGDQGSRSRRGDNTAPDNRIEIELNGRTHKVSRDTAASYQRLRDSLKAADWAEISLFLGWGYDTFGSKSGKLSGMTKSEAQTYFDRLTGFIEFLETLENVQTFKGAIHTQLRDYVRHERGRSAIANRRADREFWRHLSDLILETNKHKAHVREQKRLMELGEPLGEMFPPIRGEAYQETPTMVVERMDLLLIANMRRALRAENPAFSAWAARLPASYSRWSDTDYPPNKVTFTEYDAIILNGALQELTCAQRDYARNVIDSRPAFSDPAFTNFFRWSLYNSYSPPPRRAMGARNVVGNEDDREAFRLPGLTLEERRSFGYGGCPS